MALGEFNLTTLTRPNTVAGRRRTTGHLFVLNRAYHVTAGEFTKAHEGERPPSYARMIGQQHRLAADIEETVRNLTVTWESDPGTREQVVALAPGSLILRAFPLEGDGDWCIGVHLEPYRRRPTLAERCELFGLSATQYELVRLLFDGFSEADVAAMLGVAELELHASLEKIERSLSVESYGELVAKLAGTAARKDPR